MCNQVKKKAESSTDEVVIIRCCASVYCVVQKKGFVVQCSNSLKGEALSLSILALMKQTFPSKQNSCGSHWNSHSYTGGSPYFAGFHAVHTFIYT